MQYRPFAVVTIEGDPAMSQWQRTQHVMPCKMKTGVEEGGLRVCGGGGAQGVT